jgi:mannose-6-phosphate isomerase
VVNQKHLPVNQLEASARPMLLDAPKMRRVWGGSRFAAPDGPIGEVWLVHERNTIQRGPYTGSTLGDAVGTMGSALLGRQLTERGEREFPLLIKLIDTAEWLSVQVHPDDKQAGRLEGAGHRGKTEAWYVLESEPGAEIIAGVKPGVAPVQLLQAMGTSDLLDLVQRHELRSGDAVTLPAGALHALGPGLLIYEIQQSSDITYRIYDWDRPADEGRALHIEQSGLSTKPSMQIAPARIPDPAPGELTTVSESDYFTLRLGRAGLEPIDLGSGGEVFQVITIAEGEAVLKGKEWRLSLSPFGSAVIPASIASYAIMGEQSTKFLLAQPV